MIKLSSRGSFKNTFEMLNRFRSRKYFEKVEEYAQKGVEALAANTPVDTGKTAASWRYEIKQTDRSFSINWINDNKVQGVPIVVLLYYGHGTPHGRYVKGRDFITPAIRPIFDEIEEKVWKEVTSK